LQSTLFAPLPSSSSSASHIDGTVRSTHKAIPMDALKQHQPSWLRVGVPSLDHPFGLELWPIFEAAFEPIAGYKPQDFRFVPNKTPMSTLKSTCIMLLSYYVLIFGGREFMRNREPMKLSFLFKLHNFYLTVISGVLLALFAEQLIPTLARRGLFYAICDHSGGWTDKLVILYYVSALRIL
jgi:fatty acid elongase 3